jgi:hypothetical protein
LENEQHLTMQNQQQSIKILGVGIRTRTPYTELAGTETKYTKTD